MEECGGSVSYLSSDSDHQSGRLLKTLFTGRKFRIFEELLPTMGMHRFLNRLRSRELKKQFFNFLKKEAPDIISIHNLHSVSWPVDLVEVALRFAPTIWTLHDCWSFLGSFYPDYSPAPDPETTKEINRFWNNLSKDRSAHSLSAITPSNWMREQALNSHWHGSRVETIRNPIPDSYFKNLDTLACRKVLGLSEDKPVVLCIAGNLTEERKGGKILQFILESISHESVQFLLIGACAKNHFKKSDGVVHLGFLNDETTLQIAYSASDLLLHPAPVDNLPNTVAESMCMGTPVLSFSRGGLPEMVIPGQSGWLANEFTPEAMTTELLAILRSNSFAKIRSQTKETARKLFSREKIADQYFAHFKDVLGQT